MAIFSSYSWSGFPYDNLCENEGSEVSDLYAGEYTVAVHKQVGLSTLFGRVNVTEPEVDFYVNTTITTGSPTYRFCNQDLMGRGPNVTGAYPFVPVFQPAGDEWMTSEQEVVTTYYGWLSFFFA